MEETQLFVLRVWVQRGQFRASVRAVSEEVPRLFTEPGELTEFLRATVDAQQATRNPIINPGERT